MKTDTKILFICHGNVGRSQIAEGYYNDFTHSSNASSAGVDPTTPARWQKLAPEILKVMKEEDIDLSSKKAKLVTKEMVIESNRIIILCKKEDCPDFLLKQKHSPVSFWKIEDPFETSIENLRSIRDEIKLKVFGILRVY